jgi:glycosyltransferase involved in cell wall biosynthesis
MKASTSPVFSFRINPLSKHSIIKASANRKRAVCPPASLADLYHSTVSHAKIMVSAVIPARNEEASIARAVESVAAQPEIEEVIVVNDQSTDRTADIIAELATRTPKLKILNTDVLPPGWVGKNYAVALGAAAAQGDWLLFTDADTDHMPGSTRRALNDVVDRNAVLVSYSPEQELGSFWERALIPFVYCRLGAKFSYAQVNDPARPEAAANGQFLMVLRDAYEQIGGHTAIAGEILEDVALARRMKQAGYSIYFTAPMGIVRTRMYRSFRAMWQGWTKNLYPLFGGNLPSLLIELSEVLPWLEFGLLLIVWTVLLRTRTDAPWFFALFVFIALLGRSVRHGADLYKNLYPFSFIKYYVPGVCLYTAALTASWWKNTRGAVVWKGRSYPARVHPSA